MKLTTSNKLEIAKDLIQSVEWIENEIVDFESWRNNRYHFDSDRYEEDEEYRKEIEDFYDKYVTETKYKNSLVNEIVSIAVKTLLKNI